ncbi:hypothetical protein Q4508_08730 [Amphritea sp. 2_MG-2023]|jgi:hypothetical protein|uniref:hypothetical protein n=1 Tax=Amphritea TaxID=515417 RepID=UPI001C07B801|nr:MULTISPECIES: hypothetical protein [Amphritea]MBU2965485.1 hypothetical protein [Amphritea atlantica]MDO6418641.1 hypothetical protein [Amphritea sp. 2_MG-2023]MDX2421305.1 hypothetical protein [Amphritea sp.]
MIKRQTKSELRKQLQLQTQAFLKKGGEVAEVETGATGLINGSYRNAGFILNPQRQERTPLNGVLAKIDARKAERTQRTVPKSTRQRKKVIYDDFGEPLRVVFE